MALLSATTATAQGEQDLCAQELRLEAAADGLVDLRVVAPCQPYARVDIAYGPFILTEEASHQGHVDLRLPRIAAVPQATAQIGDAVLFASLPARPEPLPGFVALIWAGDAELRVSLPDTAPDALSYRFGFPLGAQARRADVLLLAPDAPIPEVLDIAISGGPCSNAPVRAAILTSESSARLPVTLPPPGCGAVEGVVRLALTSGLSAP